MLSFLNSNPYTKQKINVSALLVLFVTSFVLHAATTVPDFSQYTSSVNKKKAFFAYLMPEINRQNNILLAQRATIFDIQKSLQRQQLTDAQKTEIESLRVTYNIDESISVAAGLDELLKRVDIVPYDLALVQAANESGWGTSRFATQGYNFFGVWCFMKGCGFVPKHRGIGDEHEVAKFRDLSHGVMAYMQNLNSNKAYADMWEIRSQQRLAKQPISGIALVHGLRHYSQRGSGYVNELLNMLHGNKKYMII